MQQEPSDKNPKPRIYTDEDIAELERNTRISESTEAKITSFSQLRDELLSTPAGMVGYIEGIIRAQRSGSTVSLRTSVLKKLFNLAGKPVPKEVEQPTNDHVSLSRKELASLVTATAKNAGYGPVSRAALYLKTRFS